MNSTDKRKIQLHKMELDEKYLSRKLLEISQNTTIIIENMRKYKSKCKSKNKSKALVHEKALIKILKINKRIMRLLIEKDFIKPMGIFSINLYAIADIVYFVKEKIKKHRN